MIFHQIYINIITLKTLQFKFWQHIEPYLSLSATNGIGIGDIYKRNSSLQTVS